MRTVEQFDRQFESMKEHAHYRRLMPRLSTPEVILIRQFVKENVHLARSEFEMKVNRMFLHNPTKPKNWTLVMEVLTVLNGRIAS